MDYTDLYNFKTGAGIIVPADSDVKSGIEEKFKQIFGTDLDVTPETPVGRLIEAITVLVKSSLGVSAQSANQFNVNFATGIYLDSLAQIYGLERYKGLKTIVPIRVKLTNRKTVVAAGSLVMNKSGDVFTVDSDISADTNEGDFWYGTGTATAKEYGPVPGEEGTVTKVQNSILGWIGVTNFEATQIGSLTESDEAFRKRIKESRPIGVGFMTHLISQLNKIEGVRSLCVLENNNSVEKITNGVYLEGHSVYVCVYAPDAEDIDEAVAQAIVKVKPAGTGMVNNLDCGATLVERDVYASAGSQYKTTIYFYKPQIDYITVEIDIDSRFYTGSNIVTDVREVVTSYIAGIGIGDTIYGTLLASKIMSELSAVSVTSVKMTNSEETYVDVLDLPSYSYVKPMALSGNIKVNVLS